MESEEFVPKTGRAGFIPEEYLDAVIWKIKFTCDPGLVGLDEKSLIEGFEKTKDVAVIYQSAKPNQVVVEWDSDNIPNDKRIVKRRE